MTNADTITTAAAAVLGAFVGGALQGWGTLLAPGRQARLEHEAWLLHEQRIVFAEVAATAIETLAYIEDYEWRIKADEVELEHFNESRGVYLRSSGDLLKITAELQLVGTTVMRQAWDGYMAAEKEIRVSFLWAQEDDGQSVRNNMPALKTATTSLLALLENYFSAFPGKKR